MRLYLVAYDIADPRRLRRARKKLLGFGRPIQYSVFYCDLTPAEANAMETQLLKLIDITQDHLMIVDLGPLDSGQSRVIHHGFTPDMPTRGDAIII